MRTKLNGRGFYAVSATAMLAAALALAGCGDSDSDNGTYGNGGNGTPDETPTDTVASVTVTVSETSLGEVLTDADGMTLYLFTADTDGTSTCYDDCASSWPPLTTEGEAAVEGDADTALVGTVERDDGTVQVTYNDWPLYYWAGDAAPGDVNGQGVNDVWYVLDAEGNAIETSG